MILLFLVLSLLFGCFVSIWAYGRGFELWKCGVFGGGGALVLFLLLIILKAILFGIFAGIKADLPGLAQKLAEKVKGLL